MTLDAAVPQQQKNVETDSTLWLRTLDEVEGGDLPLIGNKAFRLAKLRQNGLAVPPGLVLTTAFFETHIRHTKLGPLWMGSPDIAVTSDSLNWLADSLKTKPITKMLIEAMTAALTAHFGPEVNSFAVRSSAIDEDQRDHTFAGVHLTELGVPRSSLPIAITRCWASALSESALEYRRAQGLSIQGIRIAVLIQPMLKPDCSGVGFTVNPLTGNREELIIEAISGLGEALVSGAIRPYFYKLANQPPHYPLLEEQAGPHEAATPPLPHSDLPELALHLERVQALMGEPQDIEWAKQGETFFILQTRPVALAAPPPQVTDPEWTRGSHPEQLPELPSPLFSSLFLRSQSRAIDFFKELGLAVDDLGPYLKLILGRPYLNLTFLKRVIAQVGIAPGQLLYTIGHTEVKTTGQLLSIDWEIALKRRRAYTGILKHLFTSGAQVKKYQTLVEEATAQLPETALSQEPAVLLGQLRQHDRIFSEFFPVNLALAGGMSALMAIGSSLLSPMNANPATLLTALAQQGLTTGEGNLSQRLALLGQLAQQSEATRAYFFEPTAGFADYETNAAISAEFRAAFSELLAQFGERADFETDLGQPRYIEAPAQLLRGVRQYVLSGEVAGKPALMGWASLSEGGLPWRRWLARPFVALLRRQLVLREALNAARASALAAARRWDLALGESWVQQGWLHEASDIFWLTVEEIEQTLVAGEPLGLKLPTTVRARRETYATYAETPLPFTLLESQIFSIVPGQGLISDSSTEVLTGLPISPGQVRGQVRVPASPDAFHPGDEAVILVLPSTDPTWLPLLHRAAGLIVEMGGLLSHGSVIAREYGIPGVANIPHATSRFHDGDLVLLDGSTGIVQRLADQ